jgi:hypothetical protein
MKKMIKDKSNKTLTKAIFNKGFRSNSSILPRSNFGVTGQVSSPQSPTISYSQPLAAIIKQKTLQ